MADTNLSALFRGAVKSVAYYSHGVAIGATGNEASGDDTITTVASATKTLVVKLGETTSGFACNSRITLKDTSTVTVTVSGTATAAGATCTVSYAVVEFY